MAIVVPDPTEVGVVGAATTPVEARNAHGGILGSLDGSGLDPAVPLVVAVLEGKGAEVTVENGERINPSPGIGAQNPGAQVGIARIGFLDEDKGLRRRIDLGGLEVRGLRRVFC